MFSNPFALFFSPSFVLPLLFLFLYFLEIMAHSPSTAKAWMGMTWGCGVRMSVTCMLCPMMIDWKPLSLLSLSPSLVTLPSLFSSPSFLSLYPSRPLVLEDGLWSFVLLLLPLIFRYCRHPSHVHNDYCRHRSLLLRTEDLDMSPTNVTREKGCGEGRVGESEIKRTSQCRRN